jgi:putative salt-induced outer membrane protein
MVRLPACTAAAAAAALSLALVSAAQAQTTLTGIEALDDRLDDIETSVRDDLARGEDAARFGNPEYRPGLSGSASLGYSAKTGNQKTQEFTLGTRLRYAQGNFVNSIGMALDFAESGGTKTREDIFGVYEAQYYFNPQFYAFAIGRVAKDGLATTAAQNRTDAFWGVGPGFRVVNTPEMAWRVQAGVGQSYLRDGVGNSVTEAGTIASSRFYWKLSDAMFVTNDTDVLKSKSALRANNDLGLNFKVTDRMATRISYLTEYNDSRAIRTDNKLGVSLVFGF